MRAFILGLALLAPLALSACADSATEEAVEEGAPAGDMEDVVGDGEIIDEPGEPEDMMDDSAMPGDSADVVGDGEIIDEAGEPDAEAIGQ